MLEGRRLNLHAWRGPPGILDRPCGTAGSLSKKGGNSRNAWPKIDKGAMYAPLQLPAGPKPGVFSDWFP